MNQGYQRKLQDHVGEKKNQNQNNQKYPKRHIYNIINICFIFGIFYIGLNDTL